MGVRLTKDSKVYIFSPANVVTGGPETLHQLAYKLRKKGVDAFIVYLPPGEHKVPEQYLRYQPSLPDEVIDSPENIFIFPEIWQSLTLSVKYAQKCVWWLGIRDIQQMADDTIHLASGSFCTEWARSKFGDALQLGDFISPEFHNLGLERNNTVLYSTKGAEIAKQISRYSMFEFRELSGMKRPEMKFEMNKSKVYVDFGWFPGRERIPREAAICGCVIFVREINSSALWEDLPLEREFKDPLVSADEKTFSSIAARIDNIVKNYSLYFDKQANYRAWCLEAEPELDTQIERIFSEV